VEVAQRRGALPEFSRATAEIGVPDVVTEHRTNAATGLPDTSSATEMILEEGATLVKLPVW
jgi:hypothetical protein